VASGLWPANYGQPATCLVRELDPGDRRSFTVRLTDHGRAAATAVDAAVRRIEGLALADVGPDDLAGFDTVLNALTEVA
jgi:DNA-binding MarR family transcriptional regulator